MAAFILKGIDKHRTIFRLVNINSLIAMKRHYPKSFYLNIKLCKMFNHQ